MLSLFPVALIAAAQAAPAPAPPRAAVVQVEIVARYPHDPAAFTEGLIWHDGALYESVGKEGESEVRRVDLRSGKVERRAAIDSRQFGEGLAAWGKTLVSLTWHDGVAYRWDARTLKPIGKGRYTTGEGWGLTSDGTSLIQSDGSPVLHLLDPATLRERRRLNVTINGRPLNDINELEWVDGAILANVWHTPYLVRIDPGSGVVTAIVDLRPVVAQVTVTDPEAVANGIAYDPVGKRLFVTGKLWPALFEIRLKP